MYPNYIQADFLNLPPRINLEFLIKLHIIKFHELKLSFFEWLNIEKLEMDLIEFKESNIWRNKCIHLNNELENNNWENVILI